MALDIRHVGAVKQANLPALLNRRNVVGVGVGYKVTASGPTDELAVVVNVARKLPKAQLAESDLIPKKIERVRTDVLETGIIRAFQEHRKRWRPTIPAGVSMGHIHVTAGTLGCLVRRGEEIFILSNNHVLADVNAGKKGDPIIQPGQYDGGSGEDRVALLDDFIPLDFGGEEADCSIAGSISKTLNQIAQLTGSSHRMQAYRLTPGSNQMDAALARPLDPAMFNPDIHGIGRPQGARDIGLGDAVKKSGRTTGVTQGRIIQVDVTTSVMYNGRAAVFNGQLMADGMSAPGDSGSAVLDSENYVVGLLYAGSGSATMITPIQKILRALNVEIISDF